MADQKLSSVTPAMKPDLRQISHCFITPKNLPPQSKQPYYLGPSEIPLLSIHYNQKGLLYHKPPDNGHHFMVPLLHRLKKSLSATLFHFYPLSGRLATTTNGVYVDCVNGPGAKFIHAALDITVSHILSPLHVPSVLVQSLFDLNKAVNYDGQSLPLLSIQVTELLDGVFIASSFNHCIADGTSFWNFFNMWSEIFQADDGDGIISISQPPILERWFPDGYSPIINLPFTDPNQFISRFKAPPELRRRFFHFSAESIADLKANANTECDTKEISSFQSLCALVWRAITRARRIQQDQNTSCMMSANYRGRLKPALPENYLGNMITSVKAEAKAGELVERGLGWSAWKVHETVMNITNQKIRESLEGWIQCPYTHQLSSISNPYRIIMGSSHRFNMYGTEFGMGKAVAVRSGYANTFDGKVIVYEGYEGGGSVDLEICLLPQNMANLESDLEFMNATSSPPHFPA